MQNPAPVAAPIFNQQQVAASFAEISSQNVSQKKTLFSNRLLATAIHASA